MTASVKSAQPSAHTPGPWQDHWNGYPNQPAIRARDSMALIAKVNHSAASDAEIEANCRLIAAAPDMLTALRAVYEANRSSTPVMLQVARVIAKAEGLEVVGLDVRAAIAKAEGRS